MYFCKCVKHFDSDVLNQDRSIANISTPTACVQDF